MVPLNVLLSAALLDLTRECERRGAEEVVLWSNLLRVIDEDSVDVGQLPQRVRLSRRAVKSITGALERAGWGVLDGRILRLTDAARRARWQWGAAITEAEKDWAGRSLREPLESLVAGLPLEYSHYPCGYGAADTSITGGNGADWKPVVRDPAVDTVSSISLLALLSQALVAFAAAYETRDRSFPLPVGVHLDASFTNGSVPLAEAPAALMITGNGKSGLERHGAVTVDRSRRVQLTPLGIRVRDGYRPGVRVVEAALPGAAALRSSLQGLDLPAHARHPDVRYVGGRIGFAEVSARD